jgi:branched-chain amino acid transport system permease protein
MANETTTAPGHPSDAEASLGTPPADLTAVEVPPEQAGEVGTTPFERRWLGGLHPGYAVLLVALIVFPLVNPSTYLLSLVTEILVFSIFTMSLDLLLGYAGLPNFGHAAFLGLGAYATAILSVKLGVSNLGLSLLAAIAVASVGAGILGLIAMRTSGVYFLMLTLTFAQIISAATQKWTDVTGGSNGLPGVRSPDLFVPGWTITDGKPFYFLTLAITAICFFLMFRLVHSPFGRSLVGIHQNQVRMRAMGYDVTRYRLAIFWVAGVFASVAGVMYTLFNHFISPSDVGFAISGTAVLMVLLGGEGTLIGALLGTTAYVLIQNTVSSFTEHWQLILGALFVVFVLFVRGGVMGVWARIRGRRTRGAA